MNIKIISYGKLLQMVQKYYSNQSLLCIDKLAYESIIKCDVDIRRDLYTNTVLSDGITMFTAWY